VKIYPRLLSVRNKHFDVANVEEITQIKKLTDSVDGWLTDYEGALLYNLAKNCSGQGVIVEIGSWKGRSTIWLAKGTQAGNKKAQVYAIDPHTGTSKQQKKYGSVWTFDKFKENIHRTDVDDIVIPIVKTSEKAAVAFKKPVELIFIDGAHEYEMVKRDIELWFPKVIDGGIMAFHDTTWKTGPKKAVEELVYRSDKFRNIGLVHSITFAQKVQHNSIQDKLMNRYLLLLKSLNDLNRNKLRLTIPKPLKMLAKHPFMRNK